jgi:hypothetical protein
MVDLRAEGPGPQIEVDIEMAEPAADAGEIGFVVAVEVTHGDRRRIGPDADRPSCGEAADCGAEEQGDGVAAAVGDGQIDPPIAVEVGRGYLCGLAPDRVVLRRLERPVAETAKHRDGAVSGVGGDDVEAVIAVDVDREDVRGFRPHREILAGQELPVSLPEQQAHAGTGLVRGDDVNLAVAVEVAHGHCRGVAPLRYEAPFVGTDDEAGRCNETWQIASFEVLDPKLSARCNGPPVTIASWSGHARASRHDRADGRAGRATYLGCKRLIRD